MKKHDVERETKVKSTESHSEIRDQRDTQKTTFLLRSKLNGSPGKISTKVGTAQLQFQQLELEMQDASLLMKLTCICIYTSLEDIDLLMIFDLGKPFSGLFLRINE